eukprot:TRINITY_DN800_c0_g4_i1.p1 TRINITY_DN800_c0_g4~~TRINITY_DN800_c0_g4_i1.p1  ORF type:complete len:455 (+),score=64.46 TRINITY_DN800_c0_g4_i1:161-1525(+)
MASTPNCSSTIGGFSVSPKTPIRPTGSLVASTSSPYSPMKKRSPSLDGDRFIPKRFSSDTTVGHYLLTAVQAPQIDTFNNTLAKCIFNHSTPSKILSFKHSTQPVEEYSNQLRCLHQRNTLEPRRELSRKMPSVPETVLDIPDLVDDYYLNLLDWNSNNVVAIALGSSIYLWNGDTCTNQILVDLGETGVTSVSWLQGSRYLAVGTNDCEVRIFDTECLTHVRTLSGHSARVSSLSWNDSLLSSGGRDSLIINHDVRIRDHQAVNFAGHSQEVCGLKWAPNRLDLASGGNDNLLNIWDIRQTSSRWSFNQHTAAVKAIAWCPWQNHLLASGGGTADKCLKMWNTQTGECLNSVDTGSQVCSILWSKNFKELVSSHGFSENQLLVWSYPMMTKVKDLKGHSSRVLHMAMSPDGSTVCSAAGDETLRFWKIFDKPVPTTSRLGTPVRSSTLFRTIR